MKMLPTTRREVVGVVLIATLALVVGLVVTGLLVRRVETEADDSSREVFFRASESFANEIDEQIKAYARALTSVEGLFGASEEVTRGEYEAFLSRLRLAEDYPGYLGISFARRVPLAERGAFVEKVRSDTSIDAAGYPDFAIFPSGERKEYAVIDYAYRPDGGPGLSGYDLLSDEGRAEAIRKAASTGDISISKPLTILGVSDQQGFLLVLPVFEPQTGELSGYLNGVVVTNRIISDAIEQTGITGVAGVEFSIIDVATGDSYFESDNYDAIAASSENAYHRTERRISFGSRTLRVAFVGVKNFGLTDAHVWLPATVMAGGVVSTLFFTLLLVSIALSAVRADAVAREMTAELDVERRKSASRAALLHTMLDSLPIGVMIARAPSGTVEFLNRHGQELAGGINPESASLANYTKYVQFQRLNGDPYPMEELPIVVAMTQGVPTSADDIMVRRQDGSLLRLKTTTVPVRDENNELTYTVSVFEDVTGLKERERQSAEFVSIASHQMRSGLASVRWMTDLFDDVKGKLSKKQKDIIRNIAGANERMTRLVNDLLNVTRLDLGKIQLRTAPTAMAAVFEEVAEELTPHAKQKKLKIHLRTSKLPDVATDPALIREVVLNLMSNAVKYTREKTSIVVQAMRKGGFVEFSVADEGIGIPAGEVGNLFRPFFRASNVESSNIEGTGMGLYIARKIIELSGGKIWAETKEGAGSTFRFTLPVAGVEGETAA